MAVDPSGCDAMMNITTDQHPNKLQRTSSAFYLLAAFAFVVSLALTIYFSRSMSGGMQMPGGWTMSMMWMRMPGQSWIESTSMFLFMWLAMMIAMMLPSALPMLLNCTLAAGSTRTGVFLAACGYFTIWLGIGFVFYLIGISWALATMRWSSLSVATPLLTGAVLIVAGIFQFSRWKMTGLFHCRDPLDCAKETSRDQTLAGWFHGLRQGVYCGICCSGLMVSMMVLGAMNLFVMFLFAAVITIEKLFPNPHRIVRVVGILSILAGIAMVLRVSVVKF
jgi:predicted metal-binding membrane protein